MHAAALRLELRIAQAHSLKEKRRYLQSVRTLVTRKYPVAFAEVGRVADEYDLGELHSDMKADVGFGIRAFVNRLLLRVDFAVSDEGSGVQMMVSHAF